MNNTSANNLGLIDKCPSCQGWSVIRSDDGQVACATCFNLGQTIMLGRHRIGLKLPAIILYGWIKVRRWYEMIRNLILVLIVLANFYLAFQLFTAPENINKSFLEIFFQPIPINSLFWFLVLASAWSLYLFNVRQTPIHSLSRLDEENQPMIKDEIIDGLVFFTIEAKKFLAKAIENVQLQGKSILTKELLFQTLILEPKTQMIFARLEIMPAEIIQALKDYFNQPEPDSLDGHSIIISPSAKQILLSSLAESLALGFNSVNVEDILLSFIQNPGSLGASLDEMEINYDKIKAMALWVGEEQENQRAWAFWRQKGRRRPKGHNNRAWTSLPTPFLDNYSQDLTKMAGLNLLPTVRVRDIEIKSILTILSRTEKNNVLLIGEPGVGKSSIVGAVAERVLTEDVPESLRDRRLVALDLGALVSGRSSPEENLSRVLKEVERAGNIILYIGHVEALVGTSTGAFDAAAILADALSRNRFQIIASATPVDQHRYIESNPNLAALFQTIQIEEVDEQSAIRILEEEAPKIESRQKVFLTYQAIQTAVKLSNQFIQDKKLPDKAIEVIDQAAALAAQSKSRWVNEEFVIQVLKERTNAPVEDLDAGERTKLMQLESELTKRVIGQAEAVHALVEALKRARVGLKEEKKPIGSFLFVGPTGVGKTETAKALAAIYFGSEESMIRLDMSEYQERESIYQLIGQPMTSGNYVEGGFLTTPIREKPYCLILLDEFEKAHPDVLTLFLQLFDEGRLTESGGRTVSFANTIIIATSNAGSQEIIQMIQANTDQLTLRKNLLPILQRFFKPELLNRFDGIITFRSMTEEMLIKIATNMINQITKILSDKHQISLTVAPDTIIYLAKLGFDPIYGARPLKRVIQDKLEGLIANLIINQKLKANDNLVLTLDMLK